MTVHGSYLVRPDAGDINAAIANDAETAETAETSWEDSPPRTPDAASQDPGRGRGRHRVAFAEENVVVEENGPLPRRLAGRCRSWCSCRCRCLAPLEEKWPRVFALIFKVALPQLSLIALSMIFGFGLAELESRVEIEENNKSIAVRDASFRAAIMERYAVRKGPLVCARHYLVLEQGDGPGGEGLEEMLLEDLYKFYSGMEDANLYDQEYDGRMDVATALDEIDLDERDLDDISNAKASNMNILASLNRINVPEIDDVQGYLNFTVHCGNELARLVESLGVNGSFDIRDYSVSFNWIKCPADDEASNATGAASANKPAILLETFRYPDARTQELAVTERWARDRRNIFRANVSSYENDPNLTRTEAWNRALEDAFNLADGFDECIPDINAAAWFWFTVMTTIGYGNASPSTHEGRVLVWTFGFLSILVFGIVLTKAGEIVTMIFDDMVQRHKRFKFLSIKWVTVLFWGTMTYLWLLVIATTTVYWRGLVSGQVMNMADAYWFAFISITTVGLGDIYFETYTISFQEVLCFTLEFLVGFVLLANFLLVLGDFLQGLVRSRRAAFRTTLKQTPPMSRRNLADVQ